MDGFSFDHFLPYDQWTQVIYGIFSLIFPNPITFFKQLKQQTHLKKILQTTVTGDLVFEWFLQ